MARKSDKLYDTDITKLLGVPNTTLQDWKKQDIDNWRFKLYKLMKSFNKAEFEELVQRIAD
jgi:phage pi2 protein 07